MKQKQEIILKKSYDEEWGDYELTESACDFYHKYVVFYMEAIEAMSKASGSYVTGKVTREETDQEMHITIEEEWKGNGCNRLNMGGYSVPLNDLFTNSDSLYFSDFIAKLLEYGRFLANRYAEMADELGENVQYTCIGREVDFWETDILATVYDHTGNCCRTYSEDLTAEEFGGEKVTLDALQGATWYPCAPDLYWWMPAFGIEDWYENSDKHQYDLCCEFVDFFCDPEDPCGDQIQAICEYCDGGPEMSFSDGCYAAEEVSLRWFSDKMNDEGVTTDTLAAMIRSFKEYTRKSIAFLRKCSAEFGVDPTVYINDSFTGHMLFISDDNRLLFVTADVQDTQGLRTGEMSLYCKSF